MRDFRKILTYGGLKMKGKRFTEEQTISSLKEHEAGAKMSDLVRKHNVSEQSIYRWKSKYGGMEVSEANPECLCGKFHWPVSRYLSKSTLVSCPK